jgi:hypothetical protein
MTMTFTVFERLCRLDHCCICRQPEQVPGTSWRFTKGNVDIVICEPCHLDFVEWSGEPTTTAIRRSGVDPRDLIPWRGLQ